jgi:uncharacterized protein YjiK
MILYIVLAFASLVGCRGNQQNTVNENETTENERSAISHMSNDGDEDTWDFRYDLSSPNKCVLPSELIEISALTLDDDSDIMYGVNDEKAIIYGLENCKISSKNKFGKHGDYEGIEMVGKDIYILKSNGNLIQYDLLSEEVTRDIKTPLKTKNDPEGLGFDKNNNALLIACKGSPSIDKTSNQNKSKAVYTYRLADDKFVESPLFVINDDDIETHFSDQDNSMISKKAVKKKLKRALKFSPSAIAMNPKDDCYYLLSTVGKTMLVIDSNFRIVDLIFLDESYFIQPEGICFDSRGSMYISNEGKGLVANVVMFDRK